MCLSIREGESTRHPIHPQKRYWLVLLLLFTAGLLGCCLAWSVKSFAIRSTNAWDLIKASQICFSRSLSRLKDMRNMGRNKVSTFFIVRLSRLHHHDGVEVKLESQTEREREKENSKLAWHGTAVICCVVPCRVYLFLERSFPSPTKKNRENV
jgi:hypothetical protein